MVPEPSQQVNTKQVNTWNDHIQNENDDGVDLLDLWHVSDQLPHLLISLVYNEDVLFDEVDLGDSIGIGHLRKLLNYFRRLTMLTSATFVII